MKKIHIKNNSKCGIMHIRTYCGIYIAKNLNCYKYFILDKYENSTCKRCKQLYELELRNKIINTLKEEL